MARRMPTLTVPVAANIPDAGITPAEWVPVKLATERVATQRADLREFGAVGTPDDTPTFQAGIDALAASGGGTLTGMPGEYRFQQGIEWKHGVYLDLPGGNGSSHLDFSGLTNPVGGIRPSAIYGEGSRVALPALSADATKGSITITLASTPGTTIRAGDTIQLYNHTDYSFSPYRNYYRSMEFCKVLNVSGSTITFVNPLFDTYPSGPTEVYLMRPIVGGIRGASMTFADDMRGVLFRFGAHLSVSDLYLTGSNISQLEFDSSYDFNVSSIYAQNYKPTTGSGYGITLAGCQDWTIDGTYLESTHHGLTLSGSSGPNRRGRIINSTIRNMNPIAPASGGVGYHGNTEYVTLENCDLPNGINIAGDHLTVRGNRIWTGRVAGEAMAIRTTELNGASLTIEDNDIYADGAHPAGMAYVYISWHRSNHSSGHGPWEINRTNGTLILKDNRIYMGAHVPASGNPTGVYIWDNEALPANNDLQIVGNTVRHTIPFSSTVVWGIRGARTGNGVGFRDVAITGNKGNAEFSFSALGGRDVVLQGNVACDTNSYGLTYIWNSPTYAESPTITATGNVTNRNRDGGLVINGTGSTNITAVVGENTSLGNNRGGSASTNNGSVTIDNVTTLIYEKNRIGDHKSPATQIYLDRIRNVTTLHDLDNTVVGSLALTRDRSSVSINRWRGIVSGTPEGAVVASPGSVAYSTNGTMYVKTTGSGATGWKAVTTAT